MLLMANTFSNCVNPSGENGSSWWPLALLLLTGAESFLTVCCTLLGIGFNGVIFLLISAKLLTGLSSALWMTASWVWKLLIGEIVVVVVSACCVVTTFDCGSTTVSGLFIEVFLSFLSSLVSVLSATGSLSFAICSLDWVVATLPPLLSFKNV